jgi:hypothetical protein
MGFVCYYGRTWRVGFPTPGAWSRRQNSRFLIRLCPIRNDKVLREGAVIAALEALRHPSAREERYPQGLKPGYIL